MKKSIISLVLASAMLLSLAACGKGSGKSVALYTEGMPYTETVKGEADKVVKLSYEFIGGENVMPVGGFFAPYASGGSTNGNAKPDYLTDKVFQQITDAGVNMMFYSQNRWTLGGGNYELNKALELCETHGIGFYVDSFFVAGQIGTRTENIDPEDMSLSTADGVEDLRTLINELTDNGRRKSVLGILGTDEPFAPQLDNLGVLHDVFYDLDNTAGMDVYLNAIGYWAGEDAIIGFDNSADHETYMRKYFEIVKPAMLSITQYPFTSPETPDSVVSQLLYDRLLLYRQYSIDYEVPFWRMLQAGGQWNDLAQWIDSVDPYPSEGELLMDVNMSLAYGAKGIEYFPLIQPEWFAYQTGETYDFVNRNGLIGADGNLTRWYFYAKRANDQIKAVDEYLMNATSKQILVHGKDLQKLVVDDGLFKDKLDTQFAGAYSKEGKYKELKEISGDACIVGCFDYKGGTALYVVNSNRKEKAKTSLSFDRDDYRYTVIQRAVEADVVGGRLDLVLDAGEGALIVLR